MREVSAAEFSVRKTKNLKNISDSERQQFDAYF